MHTLLYRGKRIGRYVGKALLFLCLTLPSTLQAGEENRFQVNKNLQILNALLKEVEMFYVDSVDVETTVRRGVDAMLSGLDPYTEYIPEENMSELKIITTGEYGGMGAIIRQRGNAGVVIAEPYEGLPAALAGLKAGDLIQAIDTTDVSHKNSDEVSRLLKGVPNTSMTLTIQRPGEQQPRKVNITRKQIVVNTIPYYGVRNNTGYIYLNSFTGKSAHAVKSAFEDLRNNHGIESLVLDLRGNGGGVLEAAVQIVGMFVPKGNVVISTKGKLRQWDRVYRTSGTPLDTLIPLAVLIDGSSASASEIVAGAMQDLDRAVLLGERSYGKGLVQAPRNLPHNGKLKITTSRYYTPSGRCIQQLDYTHRKADGSVAPIPDSLTSVFYTANHRAVRDGGGIRPDYEVQEPELPTMLYYLHNDTVLFDFVTLWAQQHDSIAPPETFAVTDDDFEALKAYAVEKKFAYDRQSGRLLQQLEEVARFEGYLNNEDTTLLTGLKARLTPDTEQDFDRFKPELKRLLASEITKRYYYQRGAMIESLKDDAVFKKALQVLSDTTLYQQTLINK